MVQQLHLGPEIAAWMVAVVVVVVAASLLVKTIEAKSIDRGKKALFSC